MKLKSSCAAMSVAVLVAVLSLAGCGGGGSSSSTVAVANPAQFTATDVVVGTGATATAGKTATVTYTGWLYSATAADHKGTQFDSGSYTFVLGQGQVIAGFDQGVVGMRVGGKRMNGTILPAGPASSPIANASLRP